MFVGIVKEINLVFARQAVEKCSLFGFQVFPFQVFADRGVVHRVRGLAQRAVSYCSVYSPRLHTAKASAPGRSYTFRFAHACKLSVFLIALLIVPGEQPKAVASLGWLVKGSPWVRRSFHPCRCILPRDFES